MTMMTMMTMMGMRIDLDLTLETNLTSIVTEPLDEIFSPKIDTDLTWEQFCFSDIICD